MPSFKNVQGESACKKVGKRGFTDFKRSRNPHGVASRTNSSTPAVVDGDSPLSCYSGLATAAHPAVIAAHPAVTATTPVATVTTPGATAAPPAVQPFYGIQRVSDLPRRDQLFCEFRTTENLAKKDKRFEPSAARDYRNYMGACVSDGVEPQGDVILTIGNDGNRRFVRRLSKYHPESRRYNAAWN